MFWIDAEPIWLHHVIHITWEAAMASTRVLITLPNEDKKWLWKNFGWKLPDAFQAALAQKQ
jgi:hypothetical protein